MGGHRLPRPCPTGLGGGVIAEGEGEIALILSALGAKSTHIEVQPLEYGSYASAPGDGQGVEGASPLR